MIRKLVTLASLLVLTGCGAPAVVEPPPSSSFQAAPATTEPKVNPTDIEIPSIAATSSLVPLGLTPEGAHEVPSVKQPGQAGWFEPGPEAGEQGRSIILGHIDGRGQKGVFWRLRELKAGDEVEVTLENGVILHYTVTRTEIVDKDEFPADRVYAYTEKREIALITCGGVFDRAVRSYESNIIVYAELA